MVGPRKLQPRASSVSGSAVLQPSELDIWGLRKLYSFPSGERLVRRSILQTLMRTVVIVLLDPTSNRRTRLFDAAIFVHPDFLLLQAAMEPFDVAISFRMVIRRPPMRDAQPRKCLHEARRSKLRSVVGGQRQVCFAAPRRQAVQYRLLYCR